MTPDSPAAGSDPATSATSAPPSPGASASSPGASAPSPSSPSAALAATRVGPPAPRTGGDGAFWGSARDIGLVAVALLSFAGSVYTYTYVHVLGIDFSLANTSPVASLIAASKIFVDNAGGTIALAVLAAVAFGALRAAGGDAGRARLASVAGSRAVQIAATCCGAFAVCCLGYVTAQRDVRALRLGEGVNPAIVTFAPGTRAHYPQALLDANDVHGLYVVLDTQERLYVIDQPKPLAADPYEFPAARVFSIRKDDVVSVETRVPQAPVR